MFDVLMNSYTNSSSLHGALFYVVANLFFLLILSQFLIAILCGAFDEVRQNLRTEVEQYAVPAGWVEVRRKKETCEIAGEGICGHMMGMIYWDSWTCGVINKVLSVLLASEMQDGLTLLPYDRL